MRLFGRARRQAPSAASAALPEGMRVYAVGDVHGRSDLLDRLLATIEADDAARGRADTHLVMLGDLIDRGPDSAAVLRAFIEEPPRFARVHHLMGNHEEMLLKLLDDPSDEALAQFLRWGGRETLESYGVPQMMLDLPARYGAQAVLDHVPVAHRAFLRAMGDAIRAGDYLFVHAGIRPEVPLDEQASADLRWIRQPFLESEADHGVVVVHGHTIRPEPEIRRNRIGVDTGAYASGVLTALALEGTERWLLATEA